MMTDPKVLLPCPFCGGEAKLDINDDHTNKVFIYCKTCGISTDTYLPSGKQEAIAAWNRRAGGWIPIKERLPDPGKNVLATDGYSVRFVSLMENGLWKTVIDPTHWMPLPQAPEGGIE
jgi:Lar family restriction alleviation protein